MFIDVEKATKYDLLAKLEVLLDGEIQRFAIAADDHEGWVIRHRTNRDGHVVIDKDGAVEYEKVRGKVVIRLKKDAIAPRSLPGDLRKLRRT
jgi:hypothetical protein